MREDLDMRNATNDNQRSFKQILFNVSLFLVFSGIRQSKKYIKFKLMQNQGLFHARSSIKHGDSRVC